jgi:hypothetical protein
MATTLDKISSCGGCGRENAGRDLGPDHYMAYAGICLYAVIHRTAA